MEKQVDKQMEKQVDKQMEKQVDKQMEKQYLSFIFTLHKSKKERNKFSCSKECSELSALRAK